MSLPTNNYAAAVGASVQNYQFQSTASVLQRKVLIMGTALPANAGFTNYVPYLSSSPNQTGLIFGYGSMLHRMHLQVQAGMNAVGVSVPVYIMPDSETNITTPAAASGTLALTGPATAAGVYSLYIDNIQYAITCPNTTTAAALGALIVAAINADSSCPVTASGTGTVTFTAKSKGIWGNFISISVNLQATDAPVPGVTGVITAMASGAGTNSTSITAMLAALGQGDAANQGGYTDLVCGYHLDQTVLTAIGTYNGLGNTAGGLYSPVVHRPFRCLWGDTTTTSQPTTLLALAVTNNQDRCNGVIAAPGSMTHPEEIAAWAIGYMAAVNNLTAEAMYVGTIMSGIDPGNAAGSAGTRWTDTYATRGNAVGNGIGTTLAQGGYLTLQNVITFYSPAGLSSTSNGYREMRNISILQNILNAIWQDFAQSKWQGCSICADVSKVTDPTSKQKARDVDSVRVDWVALIQSFVGHNWIYSANLPMKALAPGGTAITVRPAGDGFIAVVPMVLSGPGNVFDNTVNFDIAINTLTA